MSSADYISRVNADPEKTPLQRMVEQYGGSMSYALKALRFEKYTEEQRYAIVLERLVEQQKATLALMQICLVAARAAKESKQHRLQDWADAYMEHYL
jgi:hypothetical protein